MEKHFQYQGSDIHYRVVGKGQPVMLLHGFAEDSSIWANQVSFLQNQCKLIIPDLPGTRQSTLLTKDNVLIEDYADCMNALLDNEKVANCIVLGHSMGGYITIALAELYPGKLAAYGLVHSTAFADNDEKKATRKKAIKLINDSGVYPFLKNTTPNLFSDAYKKQHPQEIADLIEQGKQFSKGALVQYYAAMMNRPDRTTALKNSAVPVLFVIGTEDIAAPLDDLLKQVHLPEVAFIHIIQNVGHMSMLESPAELNTHLINFIQFVCP